MKRISFFPLFMTFALWSNAADMTNFTAEADRFFRTYVEDGAVSYAKIQAKMIEAESLYKQIGLMKLEGVNDNTKKAFYVNAYNLIVIYWVTKHFPLRSPLDDSGFFDKVKHNVAGEMLTLNALEIKKLLLPYKDARFHFVLACAAKSCPPLASFCYRPETIDQQLTERTKLSINNNSWLRVDQGQKTVGLSKIFEWYKGDFTINGQSTIDWINKFRNEKIPKGYSVEYYEYDWRLNDQ